MGVTKKTLCPACGATVREWKNPSLAVDAIIEIDGRIVLIERLNEPYGWALPGGFVDYGETLEAAVIREMREETGLAIYDLKQFHAYSDPSRDARQHIVSVIFTAKADGEPVAGDDAKNVRLFDPAALPPLCFDHQKILEDYRRG